MKHAYLIMAHTNYQQLQLLVNLLDHPDNDFFIHIDKKSFIGDLRVKAIDSKVTIFQEISVCWGTYSLVECTFRLIECASKAGRYDYYHLLSGQDLPVRTLTEIIEFFANNEGKEFIGFVNEALKGKTEIARRAKYYHLFTRQRSSHKIEIFNKLFTLMERISLFFQICVGVDRNKKDDFRLAYGSQWFSITQRLAMTFFENEEKIRDRFRFVKCCDELVLQTLVENTEFKDSCYGQAPHYDNVRFINWGGRKHPEIMRIPDVEEARKTDALFARKFDIKQDRDAIMYLLKELKGEGYMGENIDV